MTEPEGSDTCSDGSGVSQLSSADAATMHGLPSLSEMSMSTMTKVHHSRRERSFDTRPCLSGYLSRCRPSEKAIREAMPIHE